MKRLRKHKKLLFVVGLLLGMIYYFSLPEQLFDDPYATVVNDRNGALLSARIAHDGQWRFPPLDSLPQKYITALLTFEDQRFYQHPGVDLLAMGRAIQQNITSGRVVSGGSTLTMQIVRLHRKGKKRTVWEKMLEMILATRLELRYSKHELLKLYAAHAPFGGNTVGLNAAAWRYFERSPQTLSWAEAALLAVLPNQPAMLYPGKSIRPLKAKRDRLLERLHQLGHLSATDLSLALAEPVPEKPEELPQWSAHFTDFLVKRGYSGRQIKSGIDMHVQKSVVGVLKAHHQLLKTDGINNAAALVLDVRQNKVLAYAGNVEGAGREHQEFVDVIQAPRSTGSLLKPLLYASLLSEGQILPKTLVPDVPVFYGDFAPQNFTKTYDGAVHADMAIARSLNVPAVEMLKTYGYPKFYQKLKDLGMTTLTQPAGHYGLSLILGGSEGTLWDLANIYAGMARTLSHFNTLGHASNHQAFAGLEASPAGNNRATSGSDKIRTESPHLSAASIWFTFQAMLEVYRPAEDAAWKMYSSSHKIAWKTGTSFGYRDGWAIGITPEYVVAVWVGNADGEGRPGLTGIKAAAPIMFDIFDRLPETTWFRMPVAEMTLAAIDRQSGHLASPYSAQVDTVWIPKVGLRTSASPYNRLVHLNKAQSHQVNAGCVPTDQLITKPWFVLPPKQAFYFKMKNPTYADLPPFWPGCGTNLTALKSMEMIYPEQNASLYLPVEQDGEVGKVIFEATHQSRLARVHWHLNGTYLGSTQSEHVMALQPENGRHRLVLVDDSGNEIIRTFEVLRKGE
ncbi:penicillin-binding protein 1C [Roseivirga sp. UBA1976]|uniref:penicillin-binding protein 1C n=1 Tax=Roseivirga sp. UBA1976 TaxID=1947386 RepID=UPI002580212C|nr:penicillin-binding protein 1C [Roseivirga sp. UBA1976]